MGFVKRAIEELTYEILDGLHIEDTDENYTRVFQWSMEQDLKAPLADLKDKFKQECPMLVLRGGKHE
jgi:hypothetical protein